MAIKKDILVRPLVTEKSELLTNKLSQYSFVVDRKANKIEIKKAIEDMYNVTVDSVNTAIMPSKEKTRNTKRGANKGRTSVYKKAIVRLATGEEIDFFGEL